MSSDPEEDSESSSCPNFWTYFLVDEEDQVLVWDVEWLWEALQE